MHRRYRGKPTSCFYLISSYFKSTFYILELGEGGFQQLSMGGKGELSVKKTVNYTKAVNKLFPQVNWLTGF